MLQEDITASASEYTTVKVPLNAIVGERYSRLSFDFDFSENLDASFLIDNIRIVDLYAYDLAANVKTAKSLTLGEHTNVVVTVENKGENAAENYTVILKAGNKEVFKQKVSEALAPFKSREFRVDYAPSVFDKAGDTNITAEVVFESDQNKSNNIATTSITLIAPVAPTPETLQVAQANGKVTMTWEAPDTETEEEPEEMTENFDDAETFPEFSTGGVDENTHTGMLGDWMVYDGNGGAAGYGFQGIDVPNMGDGNAWMVFTPSSSQLAQDLSANYAPHSGTQCLLSACVAEPEGNPAATDHWLISPQLPGTAQTISFWVRELVTTYGAEKFEIWTSKTNTDIGSFSLLKSASTSSDAWEEVSFSLPAGTKYFAIRHTSTDVWALLVDDITFTAGGVSFGEVTSYNVYIDGEYDDVSEETSYEYDEDVVDGYHIFAVTAVYDDGTESMPATAALKVVTDGIESIMAQGKPVHVYTVNGQYLGKVITLKGMKKGVYVINNKKVVLK